MKGKSAALVSAMLALAASTVFVGAANKAYAHTFSGDESASFLAKVAELKVQTHLIQDNLSNSTIVAWHIDKSGEFWNATDTKEVAEKNKRIANDISTGLDTLFTEAKKPKPDANIVSQTVTKLDGSLGEVISARIDTPKLQNATVNALALRTVIDEATEDYGIALGASEEGNATSSTAATSTSSSTQSNTTTTAGPTQVVNPAAYQTSSQLASVAKDMFTKLRTMAPSNATASSLDDIDKGLSALQKAIADKLPSDDVEGIVHDKIDPSLQTAFNLQVVPEFPLPVVGAVAAVIGVVAVLGRTRMFRTS